MLALKTFHPSWKESLKVRNGLMLLEKDLLNLKIGCLEILWNKKFQRYTDPDRPTKRSLYRPRTGQAIFENLV